MKISVIGAGPGDPSFLTLCAREAIVRAQRVIATRRVFAALHTLNPSSVCMELSQIAPYVESLRGAVQHVCILVSGDVGFYSASTSLKEKLGWADVECISGISSLQLLTSRFSIPYDSVKVVSVHGRDSCVTSYVSYNRRVFVLTGGRNKAHDIIAELVQSGLEDVSVTVGENLTQEGERVVTGRAVELNSLTFGNLAVMLVQNERFVRPFRSLEDAEFIRSSVPMTKRAVRTLSVSQMDLLPGDRAVDIGAGTGAVAVEMARKVYEGWVYAVERNPEAVRLIRENRARLGAYNLCVREGIAPEALEGLPAVQAAFIGGSGGRLKEIVRELMGKNEQIRIVVNAVTLETLNEALDVFKTYGIEPDILCVNAAHGEKLGSYRLMKAENPVYILKGWRSHD